MTQERPDFISEERLKELAKNFSVDEQLGYISLDLGVKHELGLGYPELRLMKLIDRRFPPDTFVFEAYEPAPNDPGYERARELKDEEILIFIKVAKRVAPESRMTERLIVESTKLLKSQEKALREAANSKSQTIGEVETLTRGYQVDNPE